MAGGAQQQNPAANAMSGGNTQMGLAQLQQALQKLGGGQNPTQQFGQGLAQMAQGPQAQMPRPMMPQNRPMPMQGAVPPQMMGIGQGMPAQGMTPQRMSMMNMLLARQPGPNGWTS